MLYVLSINIPQTLINALMSIMDKAACINS